MHNILSRDIIKSTFMQNVIQKVAYGSSPGGGEIYFLSFTH